MFDNDSNLKEVIQQQMLELRASEARFHNIVTISTDGIVIVDNVGKILFVNPAAKSLFGRKAEELLGEPFGFPIVAGETTVLDIANREGKQIIAEMRVVAAEWEQKPAYLATLHDITERREIEKGLEKARKELAATKISEDAAREYAESIINTVREPLIALDQDLRVVSASRSFYEVFKVTPKETVGQLIYDLGNKQWNIPKLRELLETILPEKATFDNYEVEHEFSTIGSRIMLLNARQIKRVWGKERIILLAIEDITERKKLEQQINQYSKELERSNGELSNFGSIVAHDLGAPLRAVSGFAGLLQKRYKEKLDAEADEYISHIVEGTGRMQHLIKDLLEYARVGTSSKPLVQVDVNIIIEKALANLMFEITESRAVITADTLPTVSADDTRLIQLFQNLVGNAIKYRSNTPHIHISAERKDGEWLFRISDNGIGIEPRQFERIFQIFQRLHTREEYSGTGIGLAICKKIVERLGGRIWVESKPGEGSTFFFTLPATE